MVHVLFARGKLLSVVRLDFRKFRQSAKHRQITTLKSILTFEITIFGRRKNKTLQIKCNNLKLSKSTELISSKTRIDKGALRRDKELFIEAQN